MDYFYKKSNLFYVYPLQALESQTGRCFFLKMFGKTVTDYRPSTVEQEGCIISSPRKRQEKRIKVSVVAGRKLVRDALAFVVGKYSQFDLAGVAAFDTECCAPAETSSADVVLVYLEQGDSLELISDLQDRMPDSRIVAVTSKDQTESPIPAGMSGRPVIIRSNQGCNLLLEAIRKAGTGESCTDQLQRAGARNRAKSDVWDPEIPGAPNDALTPREIEVISQIAEGLKSKEIADRLCISQATVRHHLSSIYGKLGVDGRLNLIIYAVETGLVRFE